MDSSHITVTADSYQNNDVNVYTACRKHFKSHAGLTLHNRRIHPVIYHEKETERIFNYNKTVRKRRWTDMEYRELVEEEALLRINVCLDLNIRLCKRFKETRTFDSIKSRRKNKGHQQLVTAALASIRSGCVVSSTPLSTASPNLDINRLDISLYSIVCNSNVDSSNVDNIINNTGINTSPCINAGDTYSVDITGEGTGNTTYSSEPGERAEPNEPTGDNTQLKSYILSAVCLKPITHQLRYAMLNNDTENIQKLIDDDYNLLKNTTPYVHVTNTDTIHAHTTIELERIFS